MVAAVSITLLGLFCPAWVQAADIAVVCPMSYRHHVELKYHYASRFACNWANHAAYCKQQGYDYYLVADHHGPQHFPPSAWGQLHTADEFGMAQHWYKVYVLQQVLPRYSAVVLIDADTLFANFSLRLPDLLIEAGERWWVMADDKGITSHTLILKNNFRSRAMVRHLWHLRHVCPACPFGEQCAVHLLIHELMMDWMYRAGKTQLYVTNDYDILPCCMPALYCKYPSGVLREANPNHSYSIQGCVWQWWFSLLDTPMRRTHRHIYWVPRGTQWGELNMQHPKKWVTQLGPCNWTSGYPPPILTEELTRRLDARPLLHGADNGPTSWRITVQPAEVYEGVDYTTGAGKPRARQRLCQVVKVRAAGTS